jgi:hypothetical protein
MPRAHLPQFKLTHYQLGGAVLEPVSKGTELGNAWLVQRSVPEREVDKTWFLL